MKIVQVTYTTTAEFADQNQTNIRAVMAELQKLKPAGVRYTTCLSADGKTFIHTAFFKSDEDQQILGELPTFKHFQEQLQASGPESLPKQELLSLVGSSYDIFDSK